MSMRFARCSLALCLVYLASLSLQHPFIGTANTSTITPTLFASLEEAARIVDITYCVGTTGVSEPFDCSSRCSEFPTFSLVKTWSTGVLLSDSCGYIALDHDPEHRRIVVAFRGTYSLSNTIADLSTLPQKYVPYDGDNSSSLVLNDNRENPHKCHGCTVHAGFLLSWQNTRPEVIPDLGRLKTAYPEYELHLIGHSLGGAVALLAALELQSRGWNPTVTTFGEPRVGNDAFVNHVDTLFSQDGIYRRVTHVDDPVPLLPPERLGYRAHAGEIFITKDDLPPALGDLKGCNGDSDMECVAAGDGSRLWQLFFAHRDYFWRLGLCMKGGDPWGWKGSYEDGIDEL